MKKKTLSKVLIWLMSAMLLGGCGDSNVEPATSETSEQTQENTQAPATTENAGKEETNPEASDTEKELVANLTSEQGILTFLAGDWTLYDRDNKKDFGVLSIKEDGKFEFTKLSNNAKGSGTLSFTRSRTKDGEEPDWYSMVFDDCKELLPEDYEFYGVEGSSGVFHVGTTEDEDLLYLKEIGNGDTIVSMFVFNTKEGSGEIGDWSYDWLFYRKNDTKNPAVIKKGETFYAWAWESFDDGVWLQPMADHVFETVEEYSEFRYMGGFFNETDNIGVLSSGITDKTDLSGIVNTLAWDSGFPLMMCEVTVDGDGNVEKLQDVDTMMYTSYYMGDVEPEFSYKGTTFIIDGFEIDVTQFVPTINAIMDAKRVGDWIIVECHNNPNISTYLFYNIYNGYMDFFEYQIVGANLIWQGDDLSTAVYQQYNTVYDIWGHQIGSVQDGELYELSFKDANTVSGKCWIVDAIGREKEYTVDFEYEPCDGAVWAYFEYLLGGARQWRRFKEMAGDALAMIIVDPPEAILDKMSYPITIEEGALDTVIVVPMVDESKITIRDNVQSVEKGRSVVYEVTAPEGMPIDTITVEAPGHDKAEWEVWQISGRTPQMSVFIK